MIIVVFLTVLLIIFLSFSTGQQEMPTQKTLQNSETGDWGWKGGGGDVGLKTKYKGTRRLKINKHSVTPLITFENAFKGICCTSS